MDIIQKGANVNIEDSETGNTALHSAIMNRKAKVSLALIEAGANVNAANQNGVTPLNMATGYQNEIVSLALIKAGAKASPSDVERLPKNEERNPSRKQRGISF